MHFAVTDFLLDIVQNSCEAGASLIQINIEETETSIAIKVTDNGKGMDAEVRDRIFEPFFTTSRSQGSTGLGLHIVFNIVTRTLQGTISCESSPGQGTRFYLTVPIQ